MTNDAADEAPGWDAIISAARAAGLTDSRHYGTGSLPGQEGAYAIDAYRQSHGWTLMTLGLTDLFAMQTPPSDVSGSGFELTIRTPPTADDQPPGWALNLLYKLSKHIDSPSSQPFAAGHRMAIGGPITGDDSSRLIALALVADPVLDPIETPSGSVAFLTLVGLTDDELAEMKATSTDAVIDAWRVANPTLVTDPSR